MIDESIAQPLGLPKQALPDKADSLGHSNTANIIRCTSQLDSIHAEVAETLPEKRANGAGGNSSSLTVRVEQVGDGRLAVLDLDLVYPKGAAQDAVRKQMPVQHLSTGCSTGDLGEMCSGLLNSNHRRDGGEISTKVARIAPDQIGQRLRIARDRRARLEPRGNT